MHEPTTYPHAHHLILSDAPHMPTTENRTPLWAIIREVLVMYVWALIVWVALGGMVG